MGGWVGRRTLEVETAVTSLAPFLAMPSFSYFRPTINPVMFWRRWVGGGEEGGLIEVGEWVGGWVGFYLEEDEGDVALGAKLNEVGSF